MTWWAWLLLGLAAGGGGLTVLLLTVRAADAGQTDTGRTGDDTPDDAPQP